MNSFQVLFALLGFTCFCCPVGAFVPSDTWKVQVVGNNKPMYMAAEEIKTGAQVAQEILNNGGAFLHPMQTLIAQTTEQSREGLFGIGTVRIVSGAAEGFAGGLVGCLGTLAALESKRSQVNSRKLCPYCTGKGTLTCAHCLGTGGILSINPDTGAELRVDCPECNSMGSVTCVNCKGDGRAVPLILDRKTSRDPENKLEEAGII
uniref:Uncharacterized protein n=1 Tax=Fibrocapsa japonica TaxID=94617 RepID=A0A7S2V166_9STRA|mmetsp:Transcript_23676/g.34431  ORF Transcript_23676/g.34431 Transcript_23676/m.34431 type:complete len:205 (+) Transcript_23676:95-709(+)|eukprot:CAMPEP_0113942336 /NCGR_PEP_ID=MMETSP1339-20121228/8068_1 /TAXON_ID=94617 /ORGANISM="Fibrocapsa japonica" /LENGTH=204 /DNA_ID=CAMNT_0000946767 /DNA_START=84 /DNA_END=698 /DNA_ORIENTATION=- /assembly_acc=CAM_ASM_000762